MAAHLESGHVISTPPALKTAIKHHHERHLPNIPWLSVYDEIRVRDFERNAQKLFPMQVQRKRPMTMDIIRQLVLWADLSKLRDREYLTICFLLHNLLLRFSELSKLQVNDIVWDHQDNVVHLRLRQPKNRPAGTEWITLANVGNLCGASMLADYWEAAQCHLADGKSPLFKCAVTPDAKEGKEIFLRWLRKLLRDMNLPASEFSGHSFRAGGATDLFRKKIPVALIKLMGRWRSDAYLIYCRENPTASARRVAEVFDDILRHDAGG